MCRYNTQEKQLADGRNAISIIKHNWWWKENIKHIDGALIHEHFTDIKGKYFFAIDITI